MSLIMMRTSARYFVVCCFAHLVIVLTLFASDENHSRLCGFSEDCERFYSGVEINQSVALWDLSNSSHVDHLARRALAAEKWCRHKLDMKSMKPLLDLKKDLPSRNSKKGKRGIKMDMPLTSFGGWCLDCDKGFYKHLPQGQTHFVPRHHVNADYRIVDMLLHLLRPEPGVYLTLNDFGAGLSSCVCLVLVAWCACF